MLPVISDRSRQMSLTDAVRAGKYQPTGGMLRKVICQIEGVGQLSGGFFGQIFSDSRIKIFKRPVG